MLVEIEQIRSSIGSKCYLPGLALALTIPDVCGSIEFSDLGSQSKKRYTKWFDKWVLASFADAEGFNSDGSPKHAYFDGSMCYQLRCKFLHEGNSRIGVTPFGEEDGSSYEYRFELVVNGCDSYGEVWEELNSFDKPSVRIRQVRLDLPTLCESLCSAAERFMLERNTIDFVGHGISYVDIASTAQSIGR